MVINSPARFSCLAVRALIRVGGGSREALINRQFLCPILMHLDSGDPDGVQGVVHSQVPQVTQMYTAWAVSVVKNYFPVCTPSALPAHIRTQETHFHLADD